MRSLSGSCATRRATLAGLLLASGCGEPEARSGPARPDGAAPRDGSAEAPLDAHVAVEGGDASASDAPADGQADAGERSARLTVRGRFFEDDDGGIVILRGVNVAGDSKVPPFVPLVDAAKLDPLREWGMNVVRLVFTWEAYEPLPGTYDDAYLAALTTIARAAWERDLWVIVDFHQDGFSRFVSAGCGDGFPEWAVASGASKDVPDNSSNCHDWAVKMSLDADMHASFGAFYSDAGGVRTRYLELWRRLSRHFSGVPGVVGYDLLNEPWGYEKPEIGPLYADAAAVVRAEHPDAILFVEGHVSTNGGVLQTDLDEPTFGNYAYSPHFYEGLALTTNAWSGIEAPTHNGFATMTAKAAEWDVPLFVGEFGIGASATNGRAYVALQYRKLDEYLASGAYWNFTPGWTPGKKDGWNGEDLSLIDDTGAPRATFDHRPYPRRISGPPRSFSASVAGAPGTRLIDLEWDHEPDRGATHLFVPRTALFGATGGTITPTGDGLTCEFTDTRTVTCSSPTPGPKRVRVTD